jgi:cellulose synthase/poly-beta-1,6-N-acetylglucosamine synthase-like glycosyltransferase
MLLQGKNKMKISIIIPAWHEEKIIVRTLDALKQLNYPLKECELIIIASTDDQTYLIAKRKRMREFGKYLVLNQKLGGKNTALQQGIKKSKGEIIVLLDADTLVDKNWLSEVISPLKEDYYCANGNWFPLEKSWLNNYSMIEKVWGRQVLNQQSANGGGGIAFKRGIIDKIGLERLFDKKIHVGVDHYFGEQFIRNGDKIHFAKNAKTRTFLNKTFKGFIRDNLRWKKGYFDLISKTRAFMIVGFNLFIVLSLAFIPYSFIQCLLSAIVSDLSLALYFPVYLFLALIDRSLTIYAAFSRKKQEIHFKGER